MKKLALIAMGIAILHGTSGAMDSKPKSELKAVSEISFEITEYYRGPLYEKLLLKSCEAKAKDKRAEEKYRKYGKEHGVDIETLRGDNFQPRKFWEQPIEEIMRLLFPVIKKHNIIDIINFGSAMYCFLPDGSDRLYDFEDRASPAFPEIIEFYFEQDAFDIIDTWMKKQGLPPVNWYDYQESLHNYYGAKTPLSEPGAKDRRLPLYEYVLPYLYF